MPDKNEKRAVVLLSGGLDSSTCAACAASEGQEIYALSIDYGQRHAVELRAAERVAAALKVREHKILKLDLRLFGGSALTDDIAAPKDRQVDDENEIPVTYVPARNTIMLSLALAYAETRRATDIFIGVNALDYSGYPDCRPEFIAAFEKLAALATKAGTEGALFRIRTPLLHLSKAEIIRLGMKLDFDYALTHSCYDPAPDGLACGHCDSCLLRLKGFAEAGYRDPLRYV